MSTQNINYNLFIPFLLLTFFILQKKYWNKLNTQQKITIMEILFSVLEFAASYNSFTNLRLRMQQIPAERFAHMFLGLLLSGNAFTWHFFMNTKCFSWIDRR